MTTPPRTRRTTPTESSGYVLIVAPSDDAHALAVRERIADLSAGAVQALITDTATFPRASSVTFAFREGGTSAVLHHAPPLPDGVSTRVEPTRDTRRPIALEDIASVWVRRPRWVGSPVAESGALQAHINASTRSTIFAALSLLRVHNPLGADRAMRNKTYQLTVATRVGLRIPETLVTSVPGEALAFVQRIRDRGGEVVYKVAVSSREAPPTRLFRDDELARIDSVRYAPTMFQERIMGGTDLRIAVAGRHIYAAEWRPSTGVEPVVDIRLLTEARMWPTPLAPEFRRAILRAHRAFELSFGVYDFKLNQRGEPFFLEVNPEGQWLDLEICAGHPVSAAFAQVLLGRASEKLQAEPFTDSRLRELESPAKAA